MGKTSIEWTDDVWNPVAGCSLVSPGCTNCYAMGEAARVDHMQANSEPRDAQRGPLRKYEGLTQDSKGGPVWTGQVRLWESALDQPLRWKRPRRIFVNSMSDLFHDGLPDEAIDRVFAVMALCPQHTFQVLTKRPERMRSYLRPHDARRADSLGAKVLALGYTDPLELLPWPLPNVWLGVSIEDDTRATTRSYPMYTLAQQGWLTWVSYEPALGPVNWNAWSFVRWIVSGGESGLNCRPSHPDWHRATRDFCSQHRIAYLFKQWGEWAPGECGSHAAVRTEQTATLFDGRWTFGKLTPRQSEELHVDDEPDVYLFGKKRAGRHLDGRLHDEYPA